MAEDLQPCSAENVRDACGKGSFGPYNRKVHSPFQGKGLEGLHIGILNADGFRLRGYTGISGCAIDLSNLRAAAESIYNGMFAAAAAHHQYGFLHCFSV